MSQVARVRCGDYTGAEDALRRALDLLGGAERFAARGEPLLLKPNLLAPHAPAQPVTTHPSVVAAALAVAADLGARVTVADSPGLFGAAKVAKSSGLLEVLKRFDVPLLDLGQTETRTVGGSTYRALELSCAALDAGRIWNLAKWKTHTMMGLTLGVKNLYGCVPGKRKVALHFRAGKDTDAFALLLLDLWLTLRPALTVLDGIVAMEGAGPSRGTPVERGLLLASDDAPALDWEACRLSGFRAEAVPTVRLSVEREWVDRSGPEVVGDDAQPMRFTPAAGSAADFQIFPAPVRRLFRSVVSPVPRFDASLCSGCGVCVEACPAGALRPGTPPEVSQKSCIRCYCCQELCPKGAVCVKSALSIFKPSSREGTP